MASRKESTAVAVARAHVQAWSNHDWDAARVSLAPDVHVMATTTQPIMKDVDLTGIDDYMTGLIEFAQTVAPGSARELATIGDDENALVLLTVQVDFGAGPVTLVGARLYQLGSDNRIVGERVVYYASAG